MKPMAAAEGAPSLLGPSALAAGLVAFHVGLLALALIGLLAGVVLLPGLGYPSRAGSVVLVLVGVFVVLVPILVGVGVGAAFFVRYENAARVPGTVSALATTLVLLVGLTWLVVPRLA